MVPNQKAFKFNMSFAAAMLLFIFTTVGFNNCGSQSTVDLVQQSSSPSSAGGPSSPGDGLPTATPTPAPNLTSANSVTYDAHITVDQFGYRTTDPKVAVIRNPKVGSDSGQTFTPGTQYQLRKSSDGTVVFTANITQWNNGATDANSGDQGWWFDFSSVTASDFYYVYDVSKKLRSPTFAIADTVYKDVLKAATRMYYYQRSGVAKDAKYAGTCWADGISYAGPNQSTQAHDITDPTNAAKVRDVSGGWYDAGDTNRYVTYARNPVHRLLLAYQQNPTAFTDDFNIPESGNGIPDVLDEVNWEIEWLIKMQNSDGTAALKAGVTGFPSPSGGKGISSITDPVFYIPTCTSSTISVAGMFAHAALVFKQFPSMSAEVTDLTSRAAKAWSAFPTNRAQLQTTCDTPNSQGQRIQAGGADLELDYKTPFPGSGLANGSQMAAAAEAAIYLFALTGDQTYNTYIKANYMQLRPYVDQAWSIYNANEGEALLFYTTLAGADATLKQTILQGKTSNAKSQTGVYGFSANASLYRSAFTEFYWGSNEYRADFGTTNLDVVSYKLDTAASYQLRASELLHFYHGVNPFATAYLTNMATYGATSSLTEIYHTWFWPGSVWSDTKTGCGPAPGYMAGGPQIGYDGSLVNTVNDVVNGTAMQPSEKRFLDINTNSPTNSWELTEPGIYYQAAYVKLLSAFVK